MESDPLGAAPVFEPICPICSQLMAQVWDREERRLFTCGTCHTDLIVPIAAWDVARENRQRKWPEKS